MYTYDQWNQSLLQYFAGDAPPGSPIFLSVEPAVLADASRLLGQPLSPDAAAQDLCEAVRRVCVRRSGRLDGDGVVERISEEEPGQVAFLATLVLAAFYMQDDDDAGVTERCYYIRLASVLGAVTQQPNRLAMGFGFAEQAEDRRAWEAWNAYLARRGLRPTARAGIGAWTHIQYATSQTLLRLSDQEWLEEHLFLAEMRRQKLSRFLSRDQLGAWLRRYDAAVQVRRRIRDLITETDPRRRDAFLAQAYAIYADCDPRASQQELVERRARGAVRRAATRVDAGLSRRVRLGQPAEYWVCPQSPLSRPMPEGSSVLIGEVRTPLLRDERAGWCQAALPASCTLAGQTWELQDAGGYLHLLFPGRSIWPLVRDPLDAESAEFGSWEEPTPGTPFLALVQVNKRGSMEALRRAELIQWRSGPSPAECLLGWEEYHDCQILQTVWSDSATELQCDAEVYDALRPGRLERLVLQGGVRFPGERMTWLSGSAPIAAGFASCEPLKLVLRRTDVASTEIEQPVNSGTPWALDAHALEPGRYELTPVHVPAREAHRALAETTFSVMAWERLSPATVCAPGAGEPDGPPVTLAAEGVTA